jgi:DNA polymerase bacteriophage-type
VSIHLDVETYSEVDLKASGHFVYAAHPSTMVLVACWTQPHAEVIGRIQTREWRWGQPPPVDLFDRISNGQRVIAHNVAFDAEIWRQVLAERCGWWWPGYEVFDCAMCAGLMTNLPGKLEQAAKFFGTVDKDKIGAQLMKKLCRPARLLLKNSDPKRHLTPQNLAALTAYCHTDVAAERGFSRALPRLSDFENKVFQRTWEMNRRGVQVDVPLVQACQRLAQAAQAKYRDKLAQLTGGDVSSETQRPSLGKWLLDRGAEMPRSAKTGAPSLSKDTRDEIVLPEGDDLAQEVMDTYDTLNKSSVAKFDKMLSCLGSDGRIRGMFQYGGAGQTGRDAGRLVQLQNLPRGLLEGEGGYRTARGLVMDGADVDALELCYGNALNVLASLIRACLIPAPGMKLVAADYSAIEGRMLAWMSEEEHVLKAYRDGLDLYKVAASLIYHTPYDSVDGKQRKIGKVSELACGYQGSHRAFAQMGANYGVRVPEAEAKTIVAAWRAGRPRTVQLWADFQDAAMRAIRGHGRRVDVGGYTFVHDGDHMRMRLPSGRMLWYRRARIGEKVWPDGGTSPQIEFYGVDDGRVGWCQTYGGCLVENADQATSREIMMEAVLRAEDQGWPMVMRVHDEMVAEIPEDDPRDHNQLCELMRSTPRWACGLPVDAAGWTGDFYRKD